MYRTMVTARLFDEAAFRLNRRARRRSSCRSPGHEGCQVGTAWPMRHGHGHLASRTTATSRVVLVAGMTPYEISWGCSPRPTIPPRAGARCRRTGARAGWASSAGSSPIATQIPHAAGIAYADRSTAARTPWSAAGSATAPTSEGDWHEGLNFAGIHRLPVIFVCENNQYAISVPQSQADGGRRTSPTARAGYGFPGVVVDGNDVLACYARHEDRPSSAPGPARARR